MAFPYVLQITITESGGSAADSATVTARNETTNETISTSTNSLGQAVLGLENLASGYLQSDRITIYCSHQSEFGESSFTVSEDIHIFNITLAAIEDSELINYCTVQDVWDELGDKTSSDITAHRVVKSIQRAESEIEEQTSSAWRQVTVTNEIIDFNLETSYKSAEQLVSVPILDRRDYWNINFNDTIKLGFSPIVSITTLERNTANENGTDSWESLTEQTGSGGDFITYKPEGLVKFVRNVPRFGKRALRVTYVYGRTSVPKVVEDLTIFLAVKKIMFSKINESQYDNPKTISVDGLTVQGNISSGTAYMKFINTEIDRLWAKVGSLKSEAF